jgi:predicted transcriptional regulator
MVPDDLMHSKDKELQELIKDLTEEELQAIDTHKYFLSQKMGYDVGIEYAVRDWIQNQSKKWRQERIKQDLKEQFEEMLKYKWIESEKAGYDLGEKACLEWITKYAKQWREWKKKQSQANK